MVNRIATALLAFLALLGAIGAASADCTGQPAANLVCASPSGSAGQFGPRALNTSDLPIGTGANTIPSNSSGFTQTGAAFFNGGLSVGTPGPGNSNPVAVTVGAGTAALGTAAIASGQCAPVVTLTAAGVLTTDVILAGFNGDPTSVVGYGPSITGVLIVYPYPSAGAVNFKVCNSSPQSITPGALTLNWRVSR